MGNARKIIRVAHIFVGIWIAIFIFSPLRLDPTATLVAQVSVIGLSISGIILWQLPRLMRLLRR